MGRSGVVWWKIASLPVFALFGKWVNSLCAVKYSLSLAMPLEGSGMYRPSPTIICSGCIKREEAASRAQYQSQSETNFATWWFYNLVVLQFHYQFQKRFRARTELKSTKGRLPRSAILLTASLKMVARSVFGGAFIKRTCSKMWSRS